MVMTDSKPERLHHPPIGFMLLTVFPLNLILLALIQIKSLMLQWNQLQAEERRGFRNPFLQRLNQRLLKAAVWPAAALVLFLPLLGIAVGILVPAVYGERIFRAIGNP